MNGLIDKHRSQQSLIAFKVKRDLGKDGESRGLVGRSWWRGFMRRHSKRLVTKRGVKFLSHRSDWSKPEFIEQMYDVIYDVFIEAGVAVKLDNPDYVIFADEVGFNTNMKDDGNIAGTKYVCGRGKTPKMKSCTSDHRFTLLPFTAASGDAIMMAVIFKGKSKKEVPGDWHSGIDIRVHPKL